MRRLVHPSLPHLLVALLLVALLLAGCSGELPLPPEVQESASASQVHPSLRPPADDGLMHLILELGAQGDPAAIAREARRMGAEINQIYENFPMIALSAPPEVVRDLSSLRGIREIHLDELRELHLDAVLEIIRADQVHDLGVTGAGTTIAVLDAGLDRNHPFFEGRVGMEACFAGRMRSGGISLCPGGVPFLIGPGASQIEIPACRTGQGVNLCTHGPHIAGVAAGRGDGAPGAPIAGVAPGARILPIRIIHRYDTDEVCGAGRSPCVRSSDSAQLSALDLVLNRLAAGENIVAVNMSFGSGPQVACGGPLSLPTLILRTARVAVVAASGNQSHPLYMSSPACLNSVISVAATLHDDAVASYSNLSQHLDFFAPGGRALSAGSVAEGNGYFYGEGTSVSAAQVSGAFALLREVVPGLTVERGVEILKTTGVPVSFPGGTAYRLDLRSALRAAEQEPGAGRR